MESPLPTDTPVAPPDGSARLFDSSAPLLSILVPCYNVERYVAQCLESILAQTFTDYELICLNDGSTDATLDVLQGFAVADKRVCVIDKSNEGYGATCNRGLAEARGTWIAIVESDDWIEPRMYERMLDYAHTFVEEVEIIKTPYWRIWMPDTPTQRKLNCSYRRRIRPPRQPFTVAEAAHLLTHHPSIWSAVYRRSFLEGHDIRFREYPGAGWADNPFFIETLVQAQRIIYLDEPFYCYREDTPEKLAQFAQRSTLLPLHRWHDMMDILEGLGIDDKRILRAHVSRGFTYLGGVIEEVPLENESVLAAAKELFERMDPFLVLDNPAVQPGSKRLFCELRGLPRPRGGRIPYTFRLIREGFYFLRNAGIGFTWYQTTHFLKTRNARTGKAFIEDS